MDLFTNALISNYTLKIPREYDWFGPLIGDWNIRYCEVHNGIQSDVKGEWYFRRVLNGAGVEDLMVCPEKTTYGEHGIAVRIFNAKEGCYDMTYTDERFAKLLRCHKEGENIVCRLLDNDTRKWVFSNIRKDSFRWNNVTLHEDGVWHVNSTIFATRKAK